MGMVNICVSSYNQYFSFSVSKFKKIPHAYLEGNYLIQASIGRITAAVGRAPSRFHVHIFRSLFVSDGIKFASIAFCLAGFSAD